MTEKELAAYADSAYQSEAHDILLEKHGINNRLTKRAFRNRPLTQEEREHNRRHSGVRSTVERVFGVLKQHYGMAKARYDGLIRNRTRFDLMCIAYNLKHGVSVLQGQCA
uniref:Transposase DDE domain-containing protein n=1 Tax=Candidatus Kentrum sp. LPFa TaxID=2126335 RepID=A0A450VR05_9GAMM|nr:MAG: Transposase DDE domain-containing protein [Candidatus Kentron sp. LPFa]